MLAFSVSFLKAYSYHDKIFGDPLFRLKNELKDITNENFDNTQFCD